MSKNKKVAIAENAAGQVYDYGSVASRIEGEMRYETNRREAAVDVAGIYIMKPVEGGSVFEAQPLLDPGGLFCAEPVSSVGP